MRRIAPPKTRKQLRSFLGLINYYRDMWRSRSETLAPLTHLTSKNVKWRWSTIEQKAFDDMKKILSKQVLLKYPNFDEPFVIYTDASKHQLGAVITQKEWPLAFYSRKLTDAQTRYTTTERELLSIVETLKEYRTILLGQRLIIYTDHQNLTYKELNTERVLRWRLLIEEYGPEMKYIKGCKNVIADLLSRLPVLDVDPQPIESCHAFYEYYANDPADEAPVVDDVMPITFKQIKIEQLKDTRLQRRLHREAKYHTLTFSGGETKYSLICYSGKIVIPPTLQKRIVDWYHTILCHPGIVRTEETIRQHFHWKGIRMDVQDLLMRCKVCQKYKKGNIKYGHLPPKQAEDVPWERLYVDLIGP